MRQQDNDLFRILDGGEPYTEPYLTTLIGVFEDLFRYPRPLVAAVNGHAIAGGCVVACTGDYRLMAAGQGRIGVPMTFGHEVAGTVERVGPEVHHVQAGAFVAAETHIACGVCSTCRTGRAHICRNLRILGVDTEGAFAEYVVVPADNAWHSIAFDVLASNFMFVGSINDDIAGALADVKQFRILSVTQEGDYNGNGIADFEIKVTGIGGGASSDFVL